MCVRALLLAAVFVCADTSSQVLQPPAVGVTEGGPAEVTCTHTITNPQALLWYQHRPGGSPQLLISGYNTNGSSGHFSMYISSGRVSTTLRVGGAGPTDAAVYYCGVRDPNTAGSELIFGTGTRLTVLPQLPDSPPAVYLLKPSSGSKNQTGSACLTTDFFPSDQVKVFINNKEGQRPPTLVQSGKRWSYGVVEWSSDAHDQPVNCSATYKKTKNYTYKGKDDVQNSCPVMSVDESFETDEKLNTLSLTVLGLKIIFIKSIAFNSLVTLKLWTH